MNLEAIKARAAAATEGPWSAHGDTHPYRGGAFLQVEPEVGSRTICDVTDQHEGNAEFIAHAREDLPKLVEAVEAVLEVAKTLHVDKQNQIRAAIREALEDES